VPARPAADIRARANRGNQIDSERQHVNSQRIRESRFEVAAAGALVDSLLAGLISWAGGVSPMRPGWFLRAPVLSLRPCQRGKTLWHACGLYKVVANVDEELKGQAEAVFHQACRQKYSFKAAKTALRWQMARSPGRRCTTAR